MRHGARAAGIAVAAVVAALLAPPAAGAATCNYTGAAGGEWHSVGNWSCASIPGSGDDVVLGSGASVTLGVADESAGTLSMSAGATLTFGGGHKLGVSGPSVLSGGTVTGPGTLNAGGGLTKNTGGQLALNGGVTVSLAADSTWSGGDICITGASTLSIPVALAVAAGASSLNCSSGDSLVAVKATGSIAVAGGTRSWFSRIDNDGLVQVDAGTLTLSAASANTDAGAWSIAAPAQLTVSASRTVSALGGPGTLTVNGGTLTVPNGATLNPSAMTLSGGSINLDGTAPATTLAQVNLQGGTLGGTRPRTITTLAAQSGTLSGQQTTTVTSLTKSTAGQLSVNGKTTVIPQTDTTWSAGDICLSDGSTVELQHALNVAAGAGTFNCSSGDSLVAVKATGSIDVAGGTRSWFSQIDNDGLMQVDAGTLTLSAASANTDAGSWSIAAPAQLTVSASRTVSALGGPGTLTVNGGTLTIPNGATLNPSAMTLSGGIVNLDGTAPATTLPQLNLQGGTLGGTRNRTIGTLSAQSGTLSGQQTTTVTSLTKSTTGQLSVNGKTTLVPQTDTSWSAGDICLTDGSTLQFQHALNVAAGAGTFNCSSGDSLVSVKQTGSIDVAGGTRSWFSQIDNDGLVQVDAGTLTLGAASPNTDAGTWSIAAPAQLTVSASRTVSALGGPGTLAINGGTLTIPNGATLNPSVLTLSGGIVNLDGTAPATTLPQVNLQGGTLGGTRNRAIGTLSALSGTLSGAQTTTVNGSFAKSSAGQLAVSGGVTLHPTAGGSWSGGDICLSGASTFQIDAALHIGSGAGTYNCSSGDSLVDVLRNGAVDVAGPSRTWFSRVRNAGLFTVPSDGTLTLAAGFQNVTGGVLAGPGTLAGDVANPGGTLRPGGKLSIGGSYSQGPAGTLEVKVDGTTAGSGYDQLAVTGAASLDGTLAIVRAPAFDPPPGTKFQLVTSATRSGTFAALTGATFGSKTFVDDGSTPGFAVVVTGGSAAPVPGTPAVSGTAAFGRTVTCDEGAWQGGPAFAYEWRRDGTPIAGATQRTYVIAADDVTHALSCHVTGTNAGGSAEATSPAVTIPAVAPVATSDPHISGSREVGQTLTCTPGAFTGIPTPALTFSWLRDGAVIDGATAPTYTVTPADAARALTCRVTATNVGGDAQATSPVVSVPAIVPAPVAPRPTSSPVISGAPAVGRTLTCAPGGFSGSPAPSLALVWLRDGLATAAGAAYRVAAADAGHTLACTVTATNAGGSVSATSAPVTVPAIKPPLSGATPKQIATAFGLPPANRCISRGDFVIRLTQPKGITIKRAAVRFNGKSVKVQRSGARWVAHVNLRHLNKRSFTIAIRITTADKRTLTAKRTYTVCGGLVAR